MRGVIQGWIGGLSALTLAGGFLAASTNTATPQAPQRPPRAPGAAASTPEVRPLEVGRHPVDRSVKDSRCCHGAGTHARDFLRSFVGQMGRSRWVLPSSCCLILPFVLLDVSALPR